MNSVVQRPAHRIFSCSFSESIIPVQSELPSLRGARATGTLASVMATVVKYVISITVHKVD